MLKTTLPMPDFSALSALRQNVEKLSARRADLVEKRERAISAKCSSESEAREETRKHRDLIISVVTLSAKNLFEAKASARAAFAMAEEWGQLSDEIGLEIARVDIDLSESYRLYLDELNRCRARFADDLLDAALAAIPDELANGLRLQAEVAEFDRQSAWHQFPSSSKTAFDFVFEQATKRIHAKLKALPATNSILPPEIASPLNIKVRPASPLEVKRIKAELDERERTAGNLPYA